MVTEKGHTHKHIQSAQTTNHTDQASTPTVQWSMTEAAMCGPVIIGCYKEVIAEVCRLQCDGA